MSVNLTFQKGIHHFTRLIIRAHIHSQFRFSSQPTTEKIGQSSQSAFYRFMQMWSGHCFISNNVWYSQLNTIQSTENTYCTNKFNFMVVVVVSGQPKTDIAFTVSFISLWAVQNNSVWPAMKIKSFLCYN